MSKGLQEAILLMKIMGIRGFDPKVSESKKWVNWVTNFGPRTCGYCKGENGKIFDAKFPPQNIPVHSNCRCVLEKVLSIITGTATMDGGKGADNWMRLYKHLPENYVNKETAESKGWMNRKGNLRKILPGATIGGDVYSNDRGELPEKTGRIWYEADINYTGGFRNGHRILYSNDGLIFVTYDHYKTFYEVI